MLKIIIRNPNIAHCIDFLILFYLFSISFFSSGLGLNQITNVLVIILVGFLLIYKITMRRFYFGTFAKIFILFLTFCYLSISWSWDSNATVVKCTTLTLLCILSILLYDYLHTEKKINFFLKAFCLNGLVYALSTVFFYGFSGYLTGLSSGIRMGDEIANVNSIGMTLAMSALLNIWFFIYKKQKWGLIVALVCSFVALGTGSRKVLAMLFVGVFMLFLLKQSKGERIGTIIKGTAVFILLIFLLQLPYFETIRMRFETLITGLLGGSGTVDSSTLKRFLMIKIGWQQFLETPFLGIGIGSSGELLEKTIGLRTYLHNNYIELLSSIGIIGTSIFYMFFLIPLKKSLTFLKTKKDELILAFTLIVVYLMAQWGMVIYYDKMPYLYIVLFFLLTERTYNENI